MTESNRWAGKTSEQIVLSPLDLGCQPPGKAHSLLGFEPLSWLGRGRCSQQEELPLLASVGVLTSSVGVSMPLQMWVPG